MLLSHRILKSTYHSYCVLNDLLVGKKFSLYVFIISLFTLSFTFVAEYMDYNCSNLAYGSTDQFSRSSDIQVLFILHVLFITCTYIYI